MSHRPIALLAALLLAGLLARDAWPPDETRYADVARGMSAGEGWLVPHLHGGVYREKPPLGFWLAAGLVRLGVPVGAAPRAVSGVAALATLALLPGIAAALGLSRGTAARAGWVLATSPLFLAHAQAGLLDASAAACVTAAIAAKLARARKPAGVRALLVVLEGLALGAALLTKGPVLLLFPLGLRLGAALARERSAASTDPSDVAALAVAVCPVGAWLLAATDAAGNAYVRSITIGQALRRLTGNAPHLRPPGFLLAVMLVGLLPWTLLGVPLARLRAAWRQRAGMRPGGGHAALLGWILFPTLLLSALRTQQPHYLLPALPALALLLGQSLATPERWATRSAAALALLASGTFWLRACTATVFTGNAAEIALAADAAVRLALALAAAVLLAVVLLPPAARAAPWVRAVIGLSAIAVTALVALARLDPWMSPRALLRNDAIQRAERLAAPQSARSAVRILSGRSEVDATRRKSLGDWLAKEPGRVALVWERDLGRLALGATAVEEIGRGHLRTRPLVALRAAPATRTGAERDTLGRHAEADAASRPSGPILHR